MPYPVFTKLYESLVQPILDYGSAILGHKQYQCIQAVQNRAARYFLGVNREAPLAGVQGDMGWVTGAQKMWTASFRQWFRLANLYTGEEG